MHIKKVIPLCRITAFIALLLCVGTLFAQVESVIPARPNPLRLVNDLSGNFLTPEKAGELERKLVAYDDSTSVQIAVVIVDQLNGYSAADYATALGRKWGVGNKKTNNGVVVLINTGKKGDKRSAFIATGYGMEGAVSDLQADQILNTIMFPAFKDGRYYEGLDQSVDAVIQAAQGRFKAPENYHQGGNGIDPFKIIVIIVVVIVIISIISRNSGGGGGYMSRRGFWPGGFIIPGGGGGGGWTGGGGDSGGGGFGGFGGGSFGGGGAGGSW